MLEGYCIMGQILGESAMLLGKVSLLYMAKY